MKKPKAILISFFDSSNMGDLFLSGKLSELLAQKYEVVNYDFVNGKKPSPKTVYSASPVKKSGRLRKFAISVKVFIINRFRKFPELEKEMQECETLFIGGGNMMMDLEFLPSYTLKFMRYVSLSKKYKLFLEALCIGAGPFKSPTGRLYAKNALSRCESVTVRDNMSLEALKSLGITARLCPDPAFLLEARQKSETNCVAVNIYDGNSREIRDGYALLIKRLTHLYPKYKVILFSTEAMDYTGIQRLTEENSFSENVTVGNISNIDELLDLYSKTLFLIGTRMHSLIFAATQGLPIIGLFWQNKVKAFFELLDLSEYCFERASLFENIDNIFNAVLEIEKNRKAVTERINLQVGKLRSEIISNF